MALNDKAMTVSLIISQWTARKYDKKVSDEVEEAHGAKDAGRYNKLLISKDKLAKIQKAASKLRTFHYFNTLPWGDNGERLLPSANYLSYISELKVVESEFNVAVKEFVANYENYVQDARNRLGDLFNINDYPSEKEIASKFGIKPVIMPIPDNDFRVALDEAEVEKLKTAMEIEVQERMSNATKDSWERIKEALVAMKDKLTEKKEYLDKDGNKKIKDGVFRNSLFENVQELITIIPKLNVTGDPKLNEIVSDMTSLVIDPDTVRSDNTVRAIKAQQVDNLMNKFKDFF